MLSPAGGTKIYDVVLKIITDKELSRIDIEFIKNNIGEIVKPYKRIL